MVCSEKQRWYLQHNMQRKLTSALDVQPDFLLIDGMKGGSGEAIDWKGLQVPVHEATQGWLLAGGLSPGNVAKAVGIAVPTGVDVSSGVTLADGEPCCCTCGSHNGCSLAKQLWKPGPSHIARPQPS